MQRLNVTDRVKIIKAPPGEAHLLNKTGKIVLITDDVNCIVQLDSGDGATVTIDQLEKIS